MPDHYLIKKTVLFKLLVVACKKSFGLYHGERQVMGEAARNAAAEILAWLDDQGKSDPTGKQLDQAIKKLES